MEIRNLTGQVRKTLKESSNIKAFAQDCLPILKDMDTVIYEKINAYLSNPAPRSGWPRPSKKYELEMWNLLTAAIRVYLSKHEVPRFLNEVNPVTETDKAKLEERFEKLRTEALKKRERANHVAKAKVVSSSNAGPSAPTSNSTGIRTSSTELTNEPPKRRRTTARSSYREVPILGVVSSAAKPPAFRYFEESNPLELLLSPTRR